MLKKLTRCLLASVLFCAGIMPSNSISIKATGEESVKEADYKLYPKPQSIKYVNGNYILEEGINAIYDKDIDQYTKDRLQEVAALKNVKVSVSDKAVAGKTNIYIGVKGSNGIADTYIRNTYQVDDSLFEKTDSYFLKSDQGTISILGKDTDASFYALTTLYQIFGQMESYSIRNFEVKDYADVKSRGFIEGYYGNPWSLQDRIDLMKFGGYYKMNSYFYAPKDDPKHNAKWRELYTDSELQNIKALADAGNASKCRFVFALHPFMNNPMRFDTEEHYQNDLNILKAKFKQVIDNGVREIAILDDDAAVPGGNPNNAVRVLNDMTAWLKEIQKEYPDMKLTLPYVPSDYGGNGSGNELQTLKKAPSNVQIVMTGGKVWGEVSKSFTETYTNNMGTGPFMWVNWPCTDNSKKHLIMGGNKTFLHAGVDPNKIQGIMLNPMQQSEPSKVAIFANAAYAWNIWDNDAEADQAWEDSFSFVDHNNAIDTEASKAMRELSKHMMNQNMDSRVTPLQESVELNKLLEPYKEKLNNGTVTADETDAIIQQFEILQKAAKTYRNNAGNTRTRDQIVYWLNCWDDTTEAAIAYLKGIKASLLKDTSSVMRYTNEGQKAFDKSKTYGYHYVDHTEYAEVGVQHIVPFIKDTGKYLNNYVKSVINPNIITKKFITNRTDTPVGDIENVFDGKDDTSISYRNPAAVAKDDYVGVMFNKAIDVKNIRFLLGGGKNHFDQAKLQYTTDGKTWQDVDGTLHNGVLNQEQEIVVDNLTKKAMGIRLIATKNNNLDAWLEVKEIQVNKTAEESDTPYSSTVALHGLSLQSSKPASNITDGDITSEAWLAKGPYTGDDRDTIGVDADVTLTFDSAKPIGKIYVAQGYSAATDVLSNADIEYLNDTGNWVKLGSMNNNKEQTFDVSSQNITTTAIRIRNKTKTAGWWRLGEIQVFAPKAQESDQYVYTNTKTDILSKAEGNKVMLTKGSVTLKPNDYIGIKLNNILEITKVDVDAVPAGGELQTSKNGIVWNKYDAGTKPDARYVRVVNTSNGDITMNVNTFVVTKFELSKPRLLECTTPIVPGWGDAEDMRPLKNDGNLFDGNLATGAEIGGFPKKGEYAIFDLGQTRTFNSFRYYVVETQFNYLRDGVFEVADTPDAKEWQPLLTVGDGVENVGSDDANRKAKDYPEFTHDSKNPGNMYKEATGLNVQGRYIRLRFTADNKNRAVYFNELQINNGEYVSTESNKDVIANCIEEPGKVPSNMFDNDISTVYKPSKPNKNFTYYLSDPTNVKSIRFAQNGEISNAEVKATILRTTTRSTTEEISLGTLNQSLSEFIIPDNAILLSVNVAWKDSIPELSEIITTTNGKQPDKTALLEEIKKSVDVNWTKDTADTFASALKVAQEVNANPFVSQDSVDMALGALKAARADAKVKADTTELKKLLAERKQQNDGDIEIYSSRSYAPYALAISEGDHAMKDEANLSTEQNAQLVKAIKDADAALVYSMIQIELAQVTLTNDDGKYNADAYSTNTFKTYEQQKAALSTIVEQDKTTRNHPKAVNTARVTYQNAVDGLANVEQLKALIADFDKYNKDLYVEDGYNVYKTAIDAAKGLLTTGTKAQVDSAVQDITEKAAALIYKSTVALQDVIKEMESLQKDNYTETTFQALATILADAKRDLAQHNDELNKTYIQRLHDARKQLVDVRSYKAALDKANQYKAEDYTKDTFQVLVNLVKDSEQLLKDGSAEELQTASDKIASAIQKLSPLAKDLEAYQQTIKKKDETLYTQESYASYKKQYENIMNLPLDNTSLPTFQSVREAFEKAEDALILKDADYSKVKEVLASVPSDTSKFTPASVKALQDAIAAVRYDKNILEQKEVDAYASAIQKALQGLELKAQSGTNDGTAGGQGNGQQGGSSNGGGVSSTPDTSDTTSVAGFAALLLLAGAVLLVIRRKKISK